MTVPIKQILKRYSGDYCFDSLISDLDFTVSMKTLSEAAAGPIIFVYVWWILMEARKRHIEKLYFLARDGYVLREIAESFCDRFNLEIECRYLYCSRVSLRMPSYWLIGDEAVDLLTLSGYYITPKSLLSRANLSDYERFEVYNDIGFDAGQEELSLNKNAFHAFADELRGCTRFRELINEKSKIAYPNTIAYLRQEGLFENDHVAIVDSGWTGSMQRSLRQLLESDGYTGKLTGFYFGMFAEPKSAEDGEFLTWYFNRDSTKADKILFCNNLFECMLSAPHGMTLGYCQDGGIYNPILKDNNMPEMEASIREQLNGIASFSKKAIAVVDFERFNADTMRTLTKKLIKRIMVYPTKAEVDVYGRFMFCDDVTESYFEPLAGKKQRQALKGYLIISRIYRKYFCTVPKSVLPELFWPYGSLAYLPFLIRSWYRLNIYVWEWLRYTIK